MGFLCHPLVRRTLATLLVLYLIYGPVFTVWSATARMGWTGLAIALPIGVLTLGCCLWALAVLHPSRNFWLLLVALAGGLALHALEPFTGLGFIYTVIFVAPYRTRLPAAITLTALDITATVAVSAAIGLPTDAAFGITAGLAYSSVFAFLLWHMREVRRTTAREAVHAERSRLAREIHDVLAHAQTAQIVHLEGARLLLERGDHAAALERVTLAVRLARGGLEETRRALDAMRGEELPLAERLERLAAEFRSATGAPCEVRVEGELGSLDAPARLAVARTAQEALTNVRKHAPGAAVSVALRRLERWCELEVIDTGGSGDGPAVTGAGYGLVGMRERAELIGGSLETGATGQGFSVVLRVPA